MSSFLLMSKAKLTMAPKIYVLTGPSASGKSTIMNELANRGHITIPETARRILNQHPEMGASARQDLMFNEQATLERALHHCHPSQSIFLDRALPDYAAFSAHIHPHLTHTYAALASIATGAYTGVFFITTSIHLPGEETPFDKDSNDGIYRVEQSPTEAMNIAHEIETLYIAGGKTPKYIKWGPPRKRADCIEALIYNEI